jgi:hypothetical protein
MSGDLVSRINQAVDECLDRCSKSSTPPDITIDGFCQELLKQGWPEADVEQVRQIATRAVIQ